MDAKTYDWNDDATVSLVNYSPLLSAPSTSAPPQNVAAQTGSTSFQLAWSANPESDIAEYKVYYDTDQPGYPYANSILTNSTTPSYILTGLTTGTTYYIAVAAIDADGNESWISSDVAVATN